MSIKNIEHVFITREEYIDKVLNYINDLQQENDKLKKELEITTFNFQSLSSACGSLAEFMGLDKDAIIEEMIDKVVKDREENAQLKEENEKGINAILELIGEIVDLKRVLKEIREFINISCSWLNIDLRDNDELLHVRAKFFKELLEIIDKGSDTNE